MKMMNVTLYLKKPWGKTMEMQWVTFADTGEGAIEQVTDSLDLTGVEVVKAMADISEDPVLISINEV